MQDSKGTVKNELSGSGIAEITGMENSMYESRQLYQKEKTEYVGKKSDAGNRTGIPAFIKEQYEAASGLSFDDVRIHYNSRKPEKLQALAYTQGNHVYMGPGQEKHLRHELGHVVQQKRGMVRPTMWINGLPVNTDSRLEQQAESGLISMHSGNDGNSRLHLEDTGENPGPVQGDVPESTADTVQGMFLKMVYEAGESFLKEVERHEKGAVDTARMYPGKVFMLMFSIQDDALIRKLGIELNPRLYQVVDPGEIESILEVFLDNSEAAGRIINLLDDDCFNWLLAAVNNKDVSAGCRRGVGAFVRERRQQEDAPGNQSYLTLKGKIEDLERKMRFVQNMPERTNYEKGRKAQLQQLLRWELRGYFRLLGKFPEDYILQKARGRLNGLEHGAAGSGPEPDAAAAVPPLPPEEAQERDKYAVTYAAQESQRGLLPKCNELSEVIKDNEPVRRGGRQTLTELAREILLGLERTKTRDRLVIYRSMDAVEALSILEFFNSSKAAMVEEAIKNDGPEQKFDVHDQNNFVELGRHYGEQAQAEKYTMIRDYASGSVPNYANVLLEFVLKPGARELLFSKSLLALPVSDSMSLGHEGFAEASKNEGMAPGYIGVKREQVEGSGTFSLGVAAESRILLQLLVDRVEVKRILYKEGLGGDTLSDLSAMGV